MNTVTRLGVFGAGSAAVFVAAFVVAGIVAPERADPGSAPAAHDHGDLASAATDPGTPAHGLTIAQDGYLLDALDAPREPGTPGDLTFRILDPHGSPVTQYTPSHEKLLHLIAVRTDGSGFRHLHPVLHDDGTWSTPVTWDAAGTYRVYADFVPADRPDATGVTLSRTVDIAGALDPQVAAPTATSTVDGFSVTLHGALRADADSTLTATVTHDGEPVTTLQPYLGAYGHLVALRDGDLAYLHVHPHAEAPADGAVSGPDIEFETRAPSAGRYLLYLDFRVDDRVHTATFVLDTVPDVLDAVPAPHDTPAPHGEPDTGHGH